MAVFNFTSPSFHNVSRPPAPRPPPRPRPPPPGYVDHVEWEGVVVIVSLAVSIITMGFDLVPPDLVCAGLMAFYTAAQIITVAEAAKGFSNTGLLTVVALYVVAEGVSRTGGLERIMNKCLGRTKSGFWALARLQVPVMFVSAFLNNTPIVSLMIPILLSWCRRNGISAKQMLIPLSHLTVFGGTMTLIGTSTNLVVSGLQTARYPNDPRLNTFNIFQITPYGLPYAVWGALYIVLFTRYLLPSGNPSRTHNLLMALRVLPLSTLAEMSVASAGLNNLDGLTLAAVGRAGTIARDVPSDFVMAVGDIVYFWGDFALVESVRAKFGLKLLSSDTEDTVGMLGQPTLKTPLVESASGWPSNVEHGVSAADAQHLYEVHVKPRAKIAGCSIRSTCFRTRFHAAVVAVHRDGHQENGKIGDIVLTGGDRLVLDVGDNFDPASKDMMENFYDVEPMVADFREFTIGFKVAKGDMLDSLVGKTIQQAGLRGIPGLFLTAITCASGDVLHAVSPDTKLELGDILWFAGNVDGIQYLLKQPGLQCVVSDQASKMKVDLLDRRLVQVVVGPRSPLVDKSAKQVEFRHKYDAVIVAIHRKGERLEGDVSQARIQPGDVLLLDTGAKFMTRFQDDRAFLLMSEVPKSSPNTQQSAWIAVALATAMVLTQVIGGFKYTEYINLWPCAILTGILMVAFRCMTYEEARRSIMWDVYLTIASTFAIGVAIDKTAITTKIADVAANASRAIGGETAALSAIYIATAFLSEVLSNNSAAAIFYPIASRLGDKLGIDPIHISIAVMLGASAGWILPWGYQCNLMVFMAGNYKAREFMRIGVPLVFWLWGGAITIFALKAHPWVAIVISLALMGTALLVGFVWEWIPLSLREQMSGAVEFVLEKLRWQKAKPRAQKSVQELFALQ